ncbi:MAG: PAS domain-containing sensor histidine kinase [Afipia sp.]|nr:PAS domain-containing sensor histidine kinase [Afipia sp.]
MSDVNFMLQGIRDPRLAGYATGSLPAWLWSADGTHILWSNAAGARVLGARNAMTLAEKIFSPADPLRRQVMQLVSRLPESGATRMERLRGFGATLGQLQTCACARLSFSDGPTGILVAAADPVGRPLSLTERAENLLGNLPVAALAFASDGTLSAANDAAKPISSYLRNLPHDSLNATVHNGEGKLETEFGRGSLHRVGTGGDTMIVALLDAITIPKQQPPAPLPAIDTPPAPELPQEIPVTKTAPVETVSELMPTDIFESAFEEVRPPASSTVADIQTPSEVAEPIVETAAPAAPEPPAAKDEQHDTSHVSATLAEMDGPHPAIRRHPLRFMWQMDEHGRFSLGSDEFSRLIGSRTAAAFGRLWSEIADVLKIDPEGKVAEAIATRGTWSGIVVNWPADGSGARLPVELSGLPMFDRERSFVGYRGFGVCRDLESLARLSAQRRDEFLYSGTTANSVTPQSAASQVEEPASESRIETPQNVLPFRLANETKAPVLTAGESSAFDELGRRISEHLETNNTSSDVPAPTAANDSAPSAVERPPLENPPAFLQPEAPPPRVSSAQDSQLLDRMPIGILVYRLDRLLYANRAFLERTGFGGLHELTEAGGLDALFVEPGSETGASTSEQGAPVTISNTKTESAESHPARLFSISWDDEPAMALIFSSAAQASTQQPVAASTAPAEDSTQAEELATILDTTAEGIAMFDGLGRILSCNRSAEALFGRSGSEIAALNLIDLFAPESQSAVLGQLENAKSAAVASLLDHGRETLGRTRDGSAIPLSMTIGRTLPDSPRFFAVFRDLSQIKKGESEILQARRQSDRATTSKTDVLGRISHEIRMPLNAIIGFADVMIEQRFGPLGNERYVEYMKDIRASGQRVMTIVDDLLDLSRIESGKIELAFVNQDLNNLIEQCVAVMQPQANRERIIIRTSLAHALPSVKADARALRQIAMNIIGSSIHLANAGGQVIVSTATTDFGDIALRVRDTGPRLNDNDIAAAMAPFRTAAAADRISPDNSVMSLSLTKALVEANKAKFNIKTAPHSGTLIEVVFAHASAIA